MVARFILIQYTKIRKKCLFSTKLPNGPKIYQMAAVYVFQMAIKCTSIFHSNALQNLPKLGYFIRKYTVWQPWPAIGNALRPFVQLAFSCLFPTAIRCYALFSISKLQNEKCRTIKMSTSNLLTEALPTRHITDRSAVGCYTGVPNLPCYVSVFWHITYLYQGCQMVCFQTKNPNLGKFWRALV
jgi:hypothetical protein